MTLAEKICEVTYGELRPAMVAAISRWLATCDRDYIAENDLRQLGSDWITLFADMLAAFQETLAR